MNPRLPLSEIRVLELANVLAGPSVGMFLAELGAEVIKIESPKSGGDGTRQWKLPGEKPEDTVSAYFASVNWGKKSVAIDLTTRKGQQLVHRLAEDCDIVLTSYRPGSAKRLKVDYPTLEKLNAAIVYVSITSFGPDSGRPGYDAIIQAESGFFFMNGSPEEPPTKMPVALMDVLAGHQAKEAVLVALLERMKSGKGRFIEVSLIQAALSGLVNQGSNWLIAGHDPQRIGSGHPNIVPYGDPFRCRDGKYLVLAVGTDGQFKRLCSVLGIEELLSNPNYKTNPDRVKNRNALLHDLQKAISGFDAEKLFAQLMAANVPVGRILSISQALDQSWAREILIGGKTGEGTINGLPSFIAQGFEKQTLSPPPEYGQDTVSVLAGKLGLAEVELANLKTTGIIDYPSSSTKS